MASWCDKLASVPSVGFGLEWQFTPVGAMLGGFSSILDSLIVNNKPTFSVSSQDQFSLNLTTQEGFSYGVEPGRIFVSFMHNMKTKHVSGGPPVLEMLSRPLPFSNLLPMASGKLADATLLLPNVKSRRINRIGIVSTSFVSMEEIPPGIGRFIEYINRPWSGSADIFSFQIVSTIQKNPSWVDKCFHTLTKPEDPSELITLSFDWQRIFVSPFLINLQAMKTALGRAESDAIAYFEDLAEGSRFDENVIRTAE